MSRHRVGIVGAGGIAHSHVRGYRSVAGSLCEVVAACDVNADALAAFCDTQAIALQFTDAQTMIASGEVDVIALLTPPSVRADVIFPAVEAGIHMLVEKPFGESYREARAYAEAAGGAGAKMAVNHELRFTPDVLAIREAVLGGRLGELLSVSHEHYCDRRNTTGWRATEERLEIAIFSIHLIDRVQWLVGAEPLAVTALTREWIPTVRGETFTALTIEFDGGIVGSIVSSWNALGLPECRLRVDGTKGSALSLKDQVTSDACRLGIQRDGSEPETTDMMQDGLFAHAMGESMRRLLEAVEDGSEPAHSARDNLKTMAIMDAAHLSAHRGGARVQTAEVVG